MPKSEYEDKLRREVQDLFNAKYRKTSCHLYFHNHNILSLLFS